MAHYKRKRARTVSPLGYSARGLEHRLSEGPDTIRWLENWPRWHDNLYHTRPARRRTKALELDVVKGVDPDNLNWPDGRKPHKYYW